MKYDPLTFPASYDGGQFIRDLNSLDEYDVIYRKNELKLN